MYMFMEMINNKLRKAFSTSNLLILILVVLLITPTVSADDWPMFGHDSNNSNVAGDNVEPPIEFLWSYKTSGNYLSPSVVLNDVVYVGSDDNNVYAISTKNGKLLWKYATLDGIHSSPAVSNDVVYVGSDDNNVYAISTKNGELLWEYVTGDNVRSSPTIFNDVIYVGSDDNNVHAFSKKNGDLKWSYNLGNDIRPSTAASNGIVYAGSRDGNLYALDSENGTLKWKYRTMGSIESFPVVSDDVVYVSSLDGSIYALDTKTGTLKWEYKIGTDIILHIAAFNNVIYVTSVDSFVYAINAETGTLRWKYDGDQSFSSSPTISGNAVYVGSNNGDLCVLDIGTGELIYKYETETSSISSVIISNGIIFISSNNGNLSAFVSEGGIDNVYVISDFKTELQNEINNSNAIVLMDGDNSLSNESVFVNEYSKDETFATEVNQESNSDKYSSIIRFLYKSSGALLILYLIFKNTKKGNAIKSIEQFSFLSYDYYNDFEAQKVYTCAKKIFEKGKHSEAMKLANKANDLCIKEQPLRILIKEIEKNKMLEAGTSESLIQKAKDEIKKFNFDEAERLLGTANEYIQQENYFLNLIDQIRNQIKPLSNNHFKETIGLIDEMSHYIKNGDFNSAQLCASKTKTIFKEELKNAEYSVKKNDLINEMKKVY